jgi:hypothetical protein
MSRALALVAGLISAFFVFYTGRLLVVTAFLTRTRVGGGGAFIGAVVFPVLALVFGWIAVRAWRRSRLPVATTTAERTIVGR